MTWVKLGCIMGYPELKSSYRKKGLLQFCFKRIPDKNESKQTYS